MVGKARFDVMLRTMSSVAKLTCISRVDFFEHIRSKKFDIPIDTQQDSGKILPRLFGVISSAGRASALQAEGRRFDPVITHHTT